MQTTDSNQKAETLTELFPLLPESMHNQVIEATRSIGDDDAQYKVLKEFKMATISQAYRFVF